MRDLRPVNKTLKDLGVKQAPFMVLVGAAMPSILAEISFVTNRQEARLLKTPRLVRGSAEALLAGVLKYQHVTEEGSDGGTALEVLAPRSLPAGPATASRSCLHSLPAPSLTVRLGSCKLRPRLIVVRIMDAPVRGLGLGDVILSAVGLTGALVIGALGLGLVVLAMVIGYRKFQARRITDEARPKPSNWASRRPPRWRLGQPQGLLARGPRPT